MRIKASYWKTLLGLLAVAPAVGGLIGCGGSPATAPNNDVKPTQAASNANMVDTKGQVPDPESPNPTGTGGSVSTGAGGTGGPGGRTFK